ncbi:MAG TPA: YggS family pyridoxal phosphate-dependent enzyme [Pyrinomonadaceae bacterium]|nr:YggS family pyridoxal phosphate-dependent enzyme [Pyrinomonadaceae bacterium]
MAAAAEVLQTRIAEVRRKIAAAVLKSGRAPESVKLVAVSKTHPAALVRQAIDLGLTDFGESRVQEAEDKIAAVGRSNAHWHLIGHLQANKVRRAVKLFDVIHSLDSTSLAQRLERACIESGRKELQVLIQVDLAGEATKSGIAVAELPELAKVVSDCSRLKLSGLMILPPFFDDTESVRPFFHRLRDLRDELRAGGVFAENSGELSMGMTHDFEVAVEEGATMLRVGTAIFGEREGPPA